MHNVRINSKKECKSFILKFLIKIKKNSRNFYPGECATLHPSLYDKMPAVIYFSFPFTSPLMYNDPPKSPFLRLNSLKF